MKAEPLTARQQVSLWLTRTSTQDIHQAFSLRSLKSLVTTGEKPNYRKSLQPSSKNGSTFFSKKNMIINRNMSTRSLMDQFISNPKEPKAHSLIRKCETELALTQDLQQRFEKKQRDYLAVERSRHRINFQGSTSQACQKTSRTSLFKQLLKKGSEGFPKTMKFQNTAPGELCGMRPARESLQNFPGLIPVNRLRSTSSNLQCSRCSSIMSVASSSMTSRATSQMSLLLDSRMANQDDPQCKICLCDCPTSAMVTLDECGCSFCKECLQQYITFEIKAGSYDISCPDPDCPAQGVLSQHQMETLTDKELLDKHRTFRLNTEVSLDTARTWCPSPGCHTICHICTDSHTKYQGVAVTCPTCVKQFCSLCSSTWHDGLDCGDRDVSGTALAPWDNMAETIKRCPLCSVPIERDAGCAQMMCKRCKHVFCWYCLASLDGDFLLRHFDSGACRGMLGHSRSSVIFHRVQIIAIFGVFGILLLAASPLILVAAPAFICCKCRSCRNTDEMVTEKHVPELASFK